MRTATRAAPAAKNKATVDLRIKNMEYELRIKAGAYYERRFSCNKRS